MFDPVTRVCDFDDDSKTENTRSAYPLEFIPNASRTGRAGHPKNIVLLTADAFGVMPPIAKLTPAQAMYHFLSGYTAKVAGTEKGLVGVAAGILDLLRRAVPAAPSVGLRQSAARLIAKHDVDCWLVNTGWTGGNYGVGRRMPIKVTRTLLTARARRFAEERQLPHRSILRAVDPPRCPASSRRSSIRSKHGRRRTNSMRPQQISSKCSAPIS